MNTTIFESSVHDIKNGYRHNASTQSYQCIICGEAFEEGEVFLVGERLFNAQRAAEAHVTHLHGDRLQQLISLDKKHTGLTDKQSALIMSIAKGRSDKEIAKTAGISLSTVRHQRFVLREKAKQAKLFLAMYEMANTMLANTDKEALVIPHDTATMVDQRYTLTTSEEQKILNTYFISFEPLKLKLMPSKEKRKIIVLKRIAAEFNRDKEYAEKELNAIIKSIYHDIATIRRYLIEYGFADRTKDCRIYWFN